MERIETALFETSFVLQTMMGPNCLRWAGELLERADIKDARRVLDLGCGMGLSSMYLAAQSSAQIFAYDLWIDATDNHERFCRQHFEDRVVPIHGEADAMPFARGYFDAVFSLDAYFYFGAKGGFLETHLTPFLRPGGLIAIAVPGLKEDFTGGVPEELCPYWQEDINLYTVAWWADLFERSPAVRLEDCFSMACHDAAWRDWLQSDNPYAVRDRDMMRAEAGKYFDTIGIIARVV